LYRLLTAADVTPVQIDANHYELLIWKTPGSSRSWLCPLPSVARPDLLADHRVLLESFGGIIERGNEPEATWLLNQTATLTAKEAQSDARFIRDCAWMFGSSGAIPIDTAAYYSVSREANGNDTLCHRETGQILLFAPDHAFKHVTVLEDCPDYSLYRIDGAPDFRTWVEAIAEQWTLSLAIGD
jgi:hypothetical protein